MIDINTKAGRTAEKWEEARRNLSTRTPRTKTEQPDWKPKDNFSVKKEFKPRKRFKNKKFVDRQLGGSVKPFASQIEGIPQAEMDRQ
jgi:hypothetical protein